MSGRVSFDHLPNTFTCWKATASELLTVVDGYKCAYSNHVTVSFIHFFLRWIGTMQICVARMLKESGIFFAVRTFNSLSCAQSIQSGMEVIINSRYRFRPRTLRHGCSWWRDWTWCSRRQCPNSSLTSVCPPSAFRTYDLPTLPRSPDFDSPITK